MANLIPLALLFLFLIFGMLLARFKFIPSTGIIDYFLNLSLYALLFFMGFRIGRNRTVGEQLASIGLLSISFALATVIGTIFILILLYRILHLSARQMLPKRESSASNIGLFHYYTDPLKLLLIVLTGFLTGLMIPVLPEFSGEILTTWILHILLFLVGFKLVRNRINLKEVLLHPETILLPIGTVAGSLLGGVSLSVIFPLHPAKALSLASGFGWYSLSGVIISNLGDPVLGGAAFLANLMRESIALLIIPFIARTRYPNIAIGVAGATSMDVTLPLIERSCGTRSVPIAITSGAILSLLVPALVPLFFYAG